MSEAIKKILVTGGAGYIGSVLIARLLLEGYQVRTIDNLNFGGRSLLGFWVHPDFEFQYGDIRSNQDVGKALEGIQAVVHLAAIVGDKACHQEPDLAIDVNLRASRLLCEAALHHKVKRFVFASTCSNYGTTGGDDTLVDETSPLNPISLYAELKVDFEKQLLNLDHPDFTPVCLRFATAYGLSPRPRFDLTVNEFTRDLSLGKKLEVYGQQFYRPYCHVVDLARACILALEADSSVVARQAFNAGDTRENYRKKDIVELLTDRLPQQRDKISYVHRDDDPRDYRVNCDKIKTKLDFSISKKVPDGIEEILAAIASGLIDDPDSPRYRNA